MGWADSSMKPSRAKVKRIKYLRIEKVFSELSYDFVGGPARQIRAG